MHACAGYWYRRDTALLSRTRKKFTAIEKAVAISDAALDAVAGRLASRNDGTGDCPGNFEKHLREHGSECLAF